MCVWLSWEGEDSVDLGGGGCECGGIIVLGWWSVGEGRDSVEKREDGWVII